MKVIFYETFSEEKLALKQHLPKTIQAEFLEKPVQAYPISNIPSIISIRTQSEIPKIWQSKLKAVLTRSTGFDHLEAFAWQSEGKEK